MSERDSPSKGHVNIVIEISTGEKSIAISRLVLLGQDGHSYHADKADARSAIRSAVEEETDLIFEDEAKLNEVIKDATG